MTGSRAWPTLPSSTHYTMHWLTRFVWVAAMASPLLVRGQWEDISNQLLIEGTTQASWLGCGMSMADFNMDGLADLTLANSNGTVLAYAQEESGQFTLVHIIEGTEQAQGVAWFDADGDDDLDLMVTRRFARIQLFMRSDETLVEEAPDRGIPANVDWECRGLAIADYDADGDLDVYVCLYHDGTTGLSPNLLFANDGNGFFTDVTEAAGVGNGIQHTFQAIWFDYDLDGDLDLWVINDRDVYPNALYQNQGNGTFIDVAPDLNAAQVIFGMTATVGDYDNDGDMELFCTNIENEPNLMLDRNGPLYQSVAPQLGVDGLQYSWGACWVDADGDMWSDLMVGTYRFPNTLPYDNYYYQNSENGQVFSDETASWPNEQTQLYCVGVMDVNQDLAPDVVGFGNMPFLQILKNTTPQEANPPGRLSIRLCATESNRWAIGALIEVHAGGQTQTQLVSNGSDYMTQQADAHFFGVADVDVVDSVVVHWPDGMREVWKNVPPNTEMMLVQKSTTAAMSMSGALCEGDTVHVTVPYDAPLQFWNGEPFDGVVVAVTEPGEYVLTSQWMGGLFEWTDTLVVNEEPAHALTIEWSEPLCAGDLGLLSWAADPDLEVSFGGDFWPASNANVPFPADSLTVFTLDTASGCAETHLFVLPEPPVLGLYLDYMPAPCHDDVAQIEGAGFGGTPPYLLNWNGADQSDLEPGWLSMTLTDAQGCVVDSVLEVVIPDPLDMSVAVVNEDAGSDASIALSISGGTPPYNVLWNTGETGDTVLTNLTEGLYSWVIEDAQGCLLLGLQDIINVGTTEHSASAWSWTSSASEWRLQAGLGVESGVTLEVLDFTGALQFRESLEPGSMWRVDRNVIPTHGVLRVLGRDGVLFSTVY